MNFFSRHQVFIPILYGDVGMMRWIISLHMTVFTMSGPGESSAWKVLILLSRDYLALSSTWVMELSAK